MWHSPTGSRGLLLPPVEADVVEDAAGGDGGEAAFRDGGCNLGGGDGGLALGVGGGARSFSSVVAIVLCNGKSPRGGARRGGGDDALRGDGLLFAGCALLPMFVAAATGSLSMRSRARGTVTADEAKCPSSSSESNPPSSSIFHLSAMEDGLDAHTTSTVASTTSTLLQKLMERVRIHPCTPRCAMGSGKGVGPTGGGRSGLRI